MTEAGYARILLDKKDTQIMKLESEITKLRIEYERQIKKLQKENTELKNQLEMSNKVYNDNLDYSNYIEGQLIKAKEILLELYDCIPSSMADICRETLQKVALFFKDSEVEK